MSIPEQLANLKGKVALITGASSGLGWATALAFAQLGVRIVVTARRAERLDELVKRIEAAGSSAIAIAGDATQSSTAAEALAQCMATFGRLDFFINNAGQGDYKRLIETDENDYDQLMNANMRSTFVFARAVAPHLIAQHSGTMVFVSSVTGLRGTGTESIYSAAKFAQVGFSQALDDELRPHGIKVCTFCPGGIKTEFAIGKGRTEEGVRSSTMMEAAEAADVIVFLCAQPANVRILHTVVRNMGEQK